MKKRTVVLATFAALLAMVLTLTACSDADTVNANLSKEADQFKCLRRITVYNARTDKIILEAEGYMSISNDAHSELVVTCKVGNDSYKKNYIYLNDYTLYVVEDITGTEVDPYHYKVLFHTNIMPDIEIVP